ncbi:hypothetical protein Zmor_025405 [Zophobas morio]|uniref:Uncharacterized protein n=1 Tax=Zophobas morio TaxID=2755281 RepID=A0AA38HU20_9CUCU|nr:hypothetical protein Zmor_025405 [Zophobas morio]
MDRYFRRSASDLSSACNKRAKKRPAIHLLHLGVSAVLIKAASRRIPKNSQQAQLNHCYAPTYLSLCRPLVRRQMRRELKTRQEQLRLPSSFV